MVRIPFQGDAGVVTAAGTSASDATDVTADFCRITAGTGGVKIVAGNVEDQGMVSNELAVDVKVYPPTSVKINGTTAGTPIILSQNRAMYYRHINSTNIIAVF